jgi:bacterioferritin
MISAHTDALVLGYLGRALSLAFSAVQLYTTHAQLVAYWGFRKEADDFSTIVQTEIKHTERITARMISLGVAPNASQLRTVPLGESLTALMKLGIQLQQEQVGFYAEAESYCHKQNFENDRIFFAQILEEKQRDLQELETWFHSLRPVKSKQPTGKSRRSFE